MNQRNSTGCGRNGASLWLAAAAVLSLAACAEDHPRVGPGGGPDGPGSPRAEGRSGPDGGPPGEGRPRRASLFVSPAGEPFRAAPGEPYPVAAWFIRADANGDGKLTRDEFVADAARFFQRLDTNQDGVIDGLELKTYETEVLPEITADRGGEPGGQQRGPQAGGSGGPGGYGGGGGGRGGGGGGRGRRGGGQGGGGGQGQASGAPAGGAGGGPQFLGAAPYTLTGDREPVAGADLDLNGRITLANFKTRAGQRFDRLDMDAKGYLTIETLPKTQAQQAAGRQRRNRPPPS